VFYQQFILGPEFAEHLPDWRKTEIRSDLRLATHPDLNVTHTRSANSSLTLIGSMLDPADPQASDVAILNHLLKQLPNFNALIQATFCYGGRWIIIAAQGKQTILFHDALGLRQVFYTNISCTDSLWAMSQPGIVAEKLQFDISAEAKEFINSAEFRTNPEYRWPCAGTPFREIKQLLPNHYLDMVTGQVYRYWPSNALDNITLTKALENLSELLPGLVTSAATRFESVIAITAGLDSRLVLAACKNFGGTISGVTVRQLGMISGHRDITVPARLFRRLALEHTLVTAEPGMTSAFSEMFNRNVFMAHEHYGPDAEAILRCYSRQKATITGSGAEVGKCRYGDDVRKADPASVTAKSLSHLVRMGDYQFPILHFNDWLNGLGDTYNLNIADLFQWEHAHGNWLAMTQLEFNIAWREIITPFNCRNVLTTMLSVPERYRKPPHYQLFTDLIERLWPELLCEPINPAEPSHPIARLKERLKSPYRLFKNLRRNWRPIG